MCRNESPFPLGACVIDLIGTRLSDAQPCFDLPSSDVSITGRREGCVRILELLIYWLMKGPLHELSARIRGDIWRYPS